MASLKDKIAEARAAGYSDEEIFAKLLQTPQGQEALKNGYSESDLREYFGLGGEAAPQDPNPVTRNAKIAVRGLAHGAAQMLDLPADMMAFGNSLLPPDWHNPGVDSLLASDGFADLVRKSGMVEFPEAQPQNAGERLNESVSTGVGASLPLLPAGPGAALLTGVGSGAGEFVANELLPGNPWAQLAGGIVGGMFGQSGVRAVERAAQRKAIEAELASANTAWDDFEESFPRIAATREAMRDGTLRAAGANHKAQLDAIDASIPAREAGPRGALGQVSDALAPGQMGWEDAGLALRAETENWFKNEMPKALDEAWKPLDDKIAKDAPISLGAFGGALDAINRKAGSAQPLVDLLTPSLPKVLQKSLGKILEGQEELGVAGFTWNDARVLRTALGDAMRDPKIMASMGDQNLKRLYAALTEDLGRTAKSAGAKDEFDAANEASRALFAIAEGPVAKVLLDDQPGRMAKGLVSRGVTDAGDLETLRAVAPKGVDALGAVGIRFGDNGTMLSDWAKLSPKAKTALVPDAAQRNAIDGAIFALGDVGRVVKAERAAAAALKASTSQVAKDDFANWKVLTAQQKLALQARKRAAEEAAKAFSNEASTQEKILSGIRTIRNLGVGGAASYGLETLGINADAIANSKLGALAAVAVPVATHGVRAVAREPGLLRGPAIGAATANALMPRETPRPAGERPEGPSAF